MVRKKLKLISLLILFAFIITQFYTSKISIKASVVDNYLTLTRTAVNLKGDIGNDISVKTGDKIDIKYKINSAPINQELKNKKIVLVMDASRSMADTDMKDSNRNNITRFKAATNSAKNFVQKFSNVNTNVEIAIVKFSHRSSKVIDFTPVATRKDEIIRAIDNMQVDLQDGGTNIGDGLRRAKNMLDVLSEDNQKHLVLLTDGQPTVWSYTGSESNFYYGNMEDYKVKWVDNEDSTGKSIGYAVGSAQKLPQSKITSYMIGFTSDINTGKMTRIKDAAKAKLVSAYDSEGLNTVYNQIADTIINEFTIDSIIFEETFPANVKITEYPQGFTVDNQKVTGTLEDISYKLEDNVYKIVNPIEFTISIEFNDDIIGENKLLQDANSLSYRDYKNQTGIKSFNQLTFDVAKSLNKAPIKMTRSIEKDKYTLINGKTEDINIGYTIAPDKIPFDDIVSEDYLKKKYVVIVADTSGSMDEKIGVEKKMDTLKRVLNSSNNDGFINKLQGKNNVNIALITYSDNAKLGNDISTAKIKDGSGNLQDFADMTNVTQVDALKQQVRDMKSSGATNIGDGLRRAYYLLNEVDQSAKKYVVLMTDGVPTAFSSTNADFDWSWFWEVPIGKYFDNSGQTPWNRNFQTINSVQYWTNSGEATRYAYNYGDNDSKEYAINYSLDMAKKIKSADMGAYIVGFSNGVNADKLNRISHAASDKDYKEATTPADLETVYKEIAGEIETDFTLGNLSFSATLPEGIQFNNIVKDGNVINGFTTRIDDNNHQIVEGSLKNIGSISYSYKEIDGKKYFVAPPISFKLVLNGTKANEKDEKYELLKNSTFIRYQDLNKAETTLYSSNDISFTIENNPSRILNHGLFVDKTNIISGGNFIESKPFTPVAAVNNTLYTAGVLVQCNYEKTKINVKIGRRDLSNINNQDSIKVYKLKEDGSYDRNTQASGVTVSPPIINSGETAINIILPNAGKYLITYNFYLKTQGTVTTITNRAEVEINGSFKELDMNLDALPEMF